MRSPRLVVLGVLLPALLLAGCSGSGDAIDPDEAAGRLDTAAAALGEAERIDFSIAVDGSLPSGVRGLESAKGFGNRTPAFEGDVTIAAGGTSLSAEVVAVDGQLWAKLGFSPDFFTIDPAEYGAPDPATLIGLPGEGVVSLLSDVEVESTSQERDGETVLTAITGTVPGEMVAALIPSADPDADVEVVVRLTDDDEVQDLTLTGAFYPDADEVTYVVTVTASDESPTIEAPTRTGGA
ncbi:LppX_LprAFG lipoprotein [Aeromicrobium sp. Sec7.5]|uniref:LppX_LprAFG lipoprotein n=1 Tax=Aeromicrobium sp. Sec7.5 TaxID=3121276 RepID=UPI002FE4D221